MSCSVCMAMSAAEGRVGTASRGEGKAGAAPSAGAAEARAADGGWQTRVVGGVVIAVLDEHNTGIMPIVWCTRGVF